MSNISDCVVDMSHFNDGIDFNELKNSGVVGVIHKATQGTTYTDPTYATDEQSAQAAGLLWGAYHFGTGSSSGTEQANYFLGVVGNDGKGTLLVLDLEQNTSGASMSLQQAEDFVTQVHNVTGRWPGLYTNNGYINDLLGQGGTNAVLANCWLWIAQYASQPKVPANWETWTLWQYTDGEQGPNAKQTQGQDLDRDMFNGGTGQCQVFWKRNS